MLWQRGLTSYPAKRLFPIEDGFETCAGNLQGSEFTCGQGIIGYGCLAVSRCSLGYEPVGMEDLLPVCRSDGTWSIQPPSCRNGRCYVVDLEASIDMLTVAHTCDTNGSPVHSWPHGTGLIITPHMKPLKSYRLFEMIQHMYHHNVSWINGMRFITHKNVGRVTKSGEFLWESWDVFLDRTP